MLSTRERWGRECWIQEATEKEGTRRGELEKKKKNF